MPSTSLEALQHRSRHQLRARDDLAERADGKPLTNLCDWLHDTVVTNRRERRKAFGEAKRFGCYEEKVPDPERETKTTWVHSRNCPRFDWKKAFDKKLAEQAAIPSAAEKVTEKMFEGVDPKTVPWAPTDTPISEVLDDLVETEKVQFVGEENPR